MSKITKEQKKEHTLNLKVFTNDKTIEYYYNVKQFHGKISSTIDPYMNNHISTLMNDFLSNNYVFEDDNKRAKVYMKQALKSKILTDNSEARNKSLCFREFKMWCESECWYNKWNLLMKGGDDASGSEKLAFKTMRSELQEKDATIHLLKQKIDKLELVDIKPTIPEILCIENKEEETLDIIMTEVDIKSTIVEEDPIEDKEEETLDIIVEEDPIEEKEEKEEITYNYDNPSPKIQWSYIDERDVEKLLRDASNDYCLFLTETYQTEIKNNKGEDATPQYEIMDGYFANWFREQEKDIKVLIDKKQIANKFADQLDASLQYIFTD